MGLHQFQNAKDAEKIPVFLKERLQVSDTTVRFAWRTGAKLRRVYSVKNQTW